MVILIFTAHICNIMICKEFDIIIWILTDMNYVQIKLLKLFQSKLRTSYIFSCAFFFR